MSRLLPPRPVDVAATLLGRDGIRGGIGLQGNSASSSTLTGSAYLRHPQTWKFFRAWLRRNSEASTGTSLTASTIRSKVLQRLAGNRCSVSEVCGLCKETPFQSFHQLGQGAGMSWWDFDYGIALHDVF